MDSTADKGNTAMLLLSDVYTTRIKCILWYLSGDKRLLKYIDTRLQNVV